MKFMRTAALLLLCLCLLPACGNKDPLEGVEVPETHAGAINPDGVKSIRYIHYNEAGETDADMTLDSSNMLVPLTVTVYDKAAPAEAAADRVKLFDLVMTQTDDSVITLTLYSDMTMEDGRAVLTGKELYDFICAFLPLPGAEAEAEA